MDQVLIKYTTNYTPILGHLKRYVALYNHIYADHIRGTVFFEVVEDGLLAIYENWDSFVALVSPKVQLYEAEHKVSPRMWQEVVTRLLFPKDGLQIEMTCSSHSLERVFPVVKEYISRVAPLAKIERDDSRIKMIFPTYEAIAGYLSYLYGKPKAEREE